MTEESHRLHVGEPPVDAEERRLRDAVVEAAMRWHGDEFGINEAGTPIDIACCALGDHHTKASAPEPTPRCEPLEALRMTHGYHWVQHGRGKLIVSYWDMQAWQDIGTTERVLPAEAHKNGWRYHSPARPDTRVEATDEALVKFMREWPSNQSMPPIPDDPPSDTEYGVAYLRDALVHFAAPPITPAQWERIRQLANTEAPQVFAEEARAVIAGRS